MDALTGTAVNALVAHLTTSGALHGRRLVIGVAGESGSGKSTAATQLVSALAAQGVSAALIHQDNYFVRPPRTNHEFRVHNLENVGPHEVQLALIAQHIADFRAGAASVITPVVHYPSNSFHEERRDFSDRSVLVVEGTYVLMLDQLDVGVFLEATHRDTHDRRMARNRDIWEPIIHTILDIEHRLIAPQADRAHWLIDRTFQLRRGPAH